MSPIEQSEQVLPSPPPTVQVPAAEDVASSIVRRWRADGNADALAELELHPELLGCKPAFLDVVYEEFVQRKNRGETVNASEFCRRFPAYRTSLQHLLEADGAISLNADVLLSDVPKPPWPSEGSTFAGFRLVRLLGSGSYARVFLAAERDLGNRPVAVKLSLHGGREAATLGRLTHPNVVPIHSVQHVEENGLSAACMPYLGEATLDTLLRRIGTTPPKSAAVIWEIAGHGGPTPDAPPPPAFAGGYVDGVLALALPLAEALAFVHGQRVTHHDLKPTNVLLTFDGRPMLLDFNLSADYRHGGGPRGGTLPYMAPELLGRDEVDPFCPRADLYAFGVILYELLTCAHPLAPVPAGLTQADLRQYLRDRIPQGCRPLEELNPDVPAALARLVERCLAADAARAPGSAAEVAAALRSVIESRQPVPAPLPARKPRWRVPVLASLALAAGVAGVALGLNAGGKAHSQGPGPAEESDEGLSPAQLAARGYERLRDPARLADAVRAFQKAADADRENGNYAAAAGYCLARQYKYDSATEYLGRALARAPQSPDVLNNLAYCDLEKGPPQLIRAELNLRKALGQNPGLLEAHRNLLLTDLRRLEEQLNKEPQVEARIRLLAEAAVNDVQTAMQLGQLDGQMSLHAAILYGIAARFHYPRAEQCRQHLEAARGKGWVLSSGRNEPLLRNLAKEGWWGDYPIGADPAHTEPLPPRLIAPQPEVVR